MKRTVDKDKTLLVDGPASVNILSGQVEVFGAVLKTGAPVVIREGKRIPFEVRAKTELNLILSETAVVNEVDGSTIPVSWTEAAYEVLRPKKTATLMVVGGVDSGKTSFCLYIANKALKEGRHVTIIDADPGQSDVGPPSTIASCHLTKPLMDMFGACAANVFFIGVTSPSSAVSKLLQGVMKLKGKALKKENEILIINTDGWVEGEDAIRYKVDLAKLIKPDFLAGIHEKNELTFLLGALTGTHKLTVETPLWVSKRDHEERKLLRELGYKKHLRGARAEAFPLSWASIGDFAFGKGVPPLRDHIELFEESFGATPLYCAETSNLVFIALRKNTWSSEEDAKDLELKLNKKVLIMRKDGEEGLLTGLHDSKDNFLAIGVVESIDYERRIIRIYTPVRDGVASLQLGRVKLDKKGRERGLTEVFAD